MIKYIATPMKEIAPGPHQIFVNAILGVVEEQGVNIEEAAEILEEDIDPGKKADEFHLRSLHAARDLLLEQQDQDLK